MAAKSTSVGTGFTNSAVTQEKVLILARKHKGLGDYVGSTLLGTAQTTPNGSTGTVEAKPIDRYTKNVLQTLFGTELHAVNQEAKKVDSVNQPKNQPGEADHGSAGLKEDLSKLLQPVSSHTGATLGNQTNIASNPMGPSMVMPGAMSAAVDKVSPQITNAFDSTFKQLKTSELGHLPAGAIGSIKSLATAANPLLSVPGNLTSDLYGGLMKAQQMVSKLTDTAMALVGKLSFNPTQLLDAVIPPELTQGILGAGISSIAGQFGNLSSLAGGFNAANLLQDQLSKVSGMAGASLTDPMSIANSYLPKLPAQAGSVMGAASSAMGAIQGGNMSGAISGAASGAVSSAVSGAVNKGKQVLGGKAGQIGQVMGKANLALSVLRDPSAALSNLLPGALNGQMNKMGAIPGLGSVGNMGAAFGPVMDMVKQQALGQILSKFPSQNGILGPLLNQQGPPPIYDTSIANQPAIGIAAMNPNIPTIQGIPIQTVPAAPIFAQLTK
jgi:hypothetical protein